MLASVKTPRVFESVCVNLSVNVLFRVVDYLVRKVVVLQSLAEPLKAIELSGRTAGLLGFG